MGVGVGLFFWGGKGSREGSGEGALVVGWDGRCGESVWDGSGIGGPCGKKEMFRILCSLKKNTCSKADLYLQERHRCLTFNVTVCQK